MEPGPRVYDFGFWLRTSAPLLMIVAADLQLQNSDRRRHLLCRGQDDGADHVRALRGGQRRRQPVCGAQRARRPRSAECIRARCGELDVLDFLAVRAKHPGAQQAAVVAVRAAIHLRLSGDVRAGAGLPVPLGEGAAEFLLNMLGEQVLCATVLGSTALLSIAPVPHFGRRGRLRPRPFR